MQYIQLRQSFKDFTIFSLSDIRQVEPGFHRRRLKKSSRNTIFFLTNTSTRVFFLKSPTGFTNLPMFLWKRPSPIISSSRKVSIAPHPSRPDGRMAFTQTWEIFDTGPSNRIIFGAMRLFPMKKASIRWQSRKRPCWIFYI